MLVIEPRVRCGFRIPKRNTTRKDGVSFWSRIRESNPPPRLGKPMYYRCTNPAYELFARALRKLRESFGGTAAFVSCAFPCGLAKSCDAAHPGRLPTAKCLCSNRRSGLERRSLPMYESCVAAIISSFPQKSNRNLTKSNRLVLMHRSRFLFRSQFLNQKRAGFPHSLKNLRVFLAS